MISRSFDSASRIDDRVEPVAGGAPLVLLHVPGGIVGSVSPAAQPGVEVDDEAVHERDQRGEVLEGRDAVADPVLEGAQVGAGRTSQRISSSSSITPVVIRSWTYDSNSAQVGNWNGSPAVGSCWNISARFDA